MSGIIFRGLITVQDAINRIGQEICPDWSGQEWVDYHKPRTAWCSPRRTAELRGTPVDHAAQAEWEKQQEVYERYDTARTELLLRLECGELKAIVIDSSKSGCKEGVRASVWRRSNASQLIDKEKAPIFHGSYYGERLGRLLIEDFNVRPVRKSSGPRESKSVSKTTLEAWFAKRVESWPVGTPPPNEDVDRMAAEAELGPITNRETFRLARRATVPEEWSKRGPRGARNKP